MHLATALALLQICVGLEKRLTPSDGLSGDRFGCSVDQDNRRVVVGASARKGAGTVTHGGAYVFEEHGGQWTQVGVLEPGNTAGWTVPAGFGTAVGCGPGTIVVGAPLAGYGKGTWGLAYAFKKVGSSWVADAILNPGDPGVVKFGTALDLDCRPLTDVLIVSGSMGGAYEFQRIGGVWVKTTKIEPVGEPPGTSFGDAVVLGQDELFVGGRLANHGGIQMGAVFVFERASGSSGPWLQKQKLTASDGAAQDEFGYSIALDGDTLAVGAPNVDFATPIGWPLPDCGAVYVFRRVNGTWVEQHKLFMPGYSWADRAGRSVALSGDGLAVGSPVSIMPSFTASNPGYVHLLERQGATWSGLERWTRSGSILHPAFNEETGAALVWSETRMVVGAPKAVENGVQIGAAYVLEADVGSGPTGPAYYCTAKIDSDGCLPRLFHLGQPSVSGALLGDEYCVMAVEIRSADAPAMLFYSTTAGAAVPFGGGFLCLAPPVRRTSPQTFYNSGSPPCLGSVWFDFNAVIASGQNPALVPGQQVWFQLWYRDNGFLPPNDIGLTSGLSALLCP
jgi:FG-GAP repeat